MNDLPLVVPNAKLSLFAVDTIISLESPMLGEAMGRSVEVHHTVEVWFASNMVFFIQDKTE